MTKKIHNKISALNKVQSGRDPIPVKRVALRQDTVSVNLSLWREAAITDLNIGDRVQFSHVKACTTDYGLQLQTTNYTKIEKPKDTSVIAFIISVTEMDMRKEIVEVLLESGEVLEMDEATWQLFDEELKKGKIEVKIDTVSLNIPCNTHECKSLRRAENFIKLHVIV
ncbi:uncharacterized protein LOC121895028 [Thunnus maccoyii]|uniref:uncharacterized protein LOC121895028 n=1 Tax=Thunnus maccoyii TaxID=8240 RepID=UPI001C4D9A7A|nr:uncharacterized protein LOC121895028 [Thunnus maccoyii]